jgi:cation transport regulator ChaC
VWGVAYEIDDQEWKNSVMAHLDHREKGGYTQHSVQFYPRQADNGIPSEGVTGMIFKRNFIEEIKDFLFLRWVNYIFAISSPIHK